jgi:hypothetical protein
MNERYDYSDLVWDIFGLVMTLCACVVAVAVTFAIVRAVFV